MAAKGAIFFKHIDEFHPSSIVQQVEPLRKLYEVRQRLNDLLVKLDGNDDLDKLLQDIVNNTDELQQIQTLAKENAGETSKGDAAAEATQPEDKAPEPATT
ncbi:hypothetical protein BGS_0835 [Beggiatoa sp. SS]|nr:hypothetical protein BGS_0835 [Beggiatoa sp. SS]